MELLSEFASSKEILIKELDELKIEFFSHSADLDYERALTSFDKNDFQNYVGYTMSGVLKAYEWYEYLVKTKPEVDHKYMLTVIIGILEKTIKNLKETVEMTKSGTEVCEESLMKLRRIKNSEIQKLLSAIHSKFIIVPDDEYYKKL